MPLHDLQTLAPVAPHPTGGVLANADYAAWQEPGVPYSGGVAVQDQGTGVLLHSGGRDRELTGKHRGMEWNEMEWNGME